MAANWRMRLQTNVAACLLVVATLTVGGCKFSPNLLSATSHSDDQEVVVRVTLRSADARTIRRRQLYFSLKVMNCSGAANGWRAEPTIAGVPAESFDFPTHGDTVQIIGRVPADIYAKYTRPCVLLEGGGYFTGTIESRMVPIVSRPRAGPNNSFKPTPLRGAA